MLQRQGDQNIDGKGGDPIERHVAHQTSEVRDPSITPGHVERQVQKFRFIQGDKEETDYRLLLATFANADAAADDNPEQKLAITNACNSGGDFVGKYYYQYEVRMFC